MALETVIGTLEEVGLDDDEFVSQASDLFPSDQPSRSVLALAVSQLVKTSETEVERVHRAALAKAKDLQW